MPGARGGRAGPRAAGPAARRSRSRRGHGGYGGRDTAGPRAPRAVVSLETRAPARNALADYHLAAARAPAWFHDPAGRVPPPALVLFGPAGAGKTVLAHDLVLDVFPALVLVDCGSLVASDPTPVLRRAIDAAVLHQAAIVFDDAHLVFRGGAPARVLRALLLETPVCAVFTSADARSRARPTRSWCEPRPGRGPDRRGRRRRGRPTPGSRRCWIRASRGGSGETSCAMREHGKIG